MMTSQLAIARLRRDLTLGRVVNWALFVGVVLCVPLGAAFDHRYGDVLSLTILGGLSFLGIQAYEYTHLVEEGLTLTHGNVHGHELHPLFGATFFVVTGFHGAHVTAGVIYLTCILFGAMKGKYTQGGLSYSPVELVGLFWHFVDLVWILVFTFIYLL